MEMKEEALKLADKLENSWISCLDCGQRVTRDSIHTCSPQLKPLSDEEIRQLYIEMMEAKSPHSQSFFGFAKAIEERHGIKNVQKT